MIQFTNKTTINEDFDAVHKVVLDGISDNMSVLFHNGKYGAIKTVDPTIIGYYAVKILTEPYMLQYEKIIYKQIIKSGELIIKVKYLIIMKANAN